MSFPHPEPGLVICYAFLWHAEHIKGQEEGSKDRPCALVLSAQNEDGDTIVTVAPITHTSPESADYAVEIPLPTKLRLGLDTERSWIIVNEVNRFVWPGPDLRPISAKATDTVDYGFLPPVLFRQVKEKLIATAKAQRIKTTPRTE